MIEKTITLTTANSDDQPAPVEVGLAYCFATEIAYRELSGEDITDFMQEAALALGGENPRMPDVKKSIFAVLAAAMAYYEAKGEKAPVRDTDLMNQCTPQEMGLALGTVMGLRTQFYTIPTGEPEEKERKGRKRKKA